MKPNYNQNDIQSLALAKAVATKLRADPALLQIGVRNIERWRQQGNTAPVYTEWLGILGKGLENVCVVLEAETNDGQRLRSSNPFPGVLSQEERLGIRKTFHNQS